MATAKPSANIFGTFLDNVAPGPSRSSVDFERITKQAIEWSSSQSAPGSGVDATGAPLEGVRGGSGQGAVSVVLKSIDAAGSPLSVVAIAKRTTLGVDAVTAALRDATFAGLLTKKETPDGGAVFDLTADGRDLIR